METKNKHRSFLINASLITGSITLTLLAVEVFLNFISFKNQTVLDDPILGIKAKAGGDRDANGYRNKEVLKGAFAVAIGDSQTDGNNAKTIEETWPHVLERLVKFPIYQMAFSGYSPAQYLYLSEQAVSLNPKVILLGFYFGNDLQDTYRLVYENDYWKDWRDPAFKVTQDVPGGESDIRLMLQTGYEKESYLLKLLRVRRYLRNNSQVYTLLGDGSRALREKVGLAESRTETNERIAQWAGANPDKALVVPGEKINTVLSPLYRLDTVDLSNKEAQEGWRLSQNIFRRLSENLKQNNIKLIIVLIPTKEAVYGKYFEDSNLEINDHFSLYLSKEKELNQTVLDFCRKENITCFDSLPSLAAKLKEGKRIYPSSMDGHPIAAGYETIGQNLAIFLKQQALID